MLPKPDVRVLSLIALALLGGVVALSLEDPAFSKARRVLAKFQDGLRTGDEVLLRRSVTSRSREFVSKLPARPESVKLEVRKLRRENSRIYLDVFDPSPDAPVAEGRFVVAKEDGEWLVDLIATAGEGAKDISTGPPQRRFVPSAMTAEQRREAQRALEASATKRQ